MTWMITMELGGGFKASAGERGKSSHHQPTGALVANERSVVFCQYQPWFRADWYRYWCACASSGVSARRRINRIFILVSMSFLVYKGLKHFL
ncbi:hypothetical protein J6590_080779 [Homalodisca vitripennis]|nr:hypothetical protein J6590_080779 [Homalodisca vitripennis]